MDEDEDENEAGGDSEEEEEEQEGQLAKKSNNIGQKSNEIGHMQCLGGFYGVATEQLRVMANTGVYQSIPKREQRRVEILVPTSV